MAHILLVEDETNLAILLESSLKDEGHTVVLTDSGSDAFTYFGNQVFDLVITDLIVFQHGGISDRSGTMLISRIRHQQATEQAAGGAKVAPILAISGTINRIGQEHMLAMATQVGADQVLAKPFEVEEFLAAVTGLLSH